MNRTLFLLAVAALCVATNAQDDRVVQLVQGRGNAVARDGRRAEFNFEVGSHKGKDEKVVTRGRFEFNQVKSDKARPVRIVAEMIPKLMTKESNGWFESRAMMVVVTENGPKRIPGNVKVHVADLVKPKDESDKKDILEVAFKAAEGDLTFEFGGAVRKGDIRVRAGSAGQPSVSN